MPTLTTSRSRQSSAPTVAGKGSLIDQMSYVCRTPNCGMIKFTVCDNCARCKDCCECGHKQRIVEVYQRDPILMEAYTEDLGHRYTPFGIVRHIAVRRKDGKPMSWSEVAAVFRDNYPEQWAIQCFPPGEDASHGTNVYHMFILQTPPVGMTVQIEE